MIVKMFLMISSILLSIYVAVFFILFIKVIVNSLILHKFELGFGHIKFIFLWPFIIFKKSNKDKRQTLKEYYKDSDYINDIFY